MSDNRVFHGKDLEEALQQASQALGIDEDRIHYRLLEEGRRGVFGLGAKEVQILVESTPLAEAGGEDEDPLDDVMPSMIEEAGHKELLTEAPPTRNSEEHKRKGGVRNASRKNNRNQRGNRNRNRNRHGKRAGGRPRQERRRPEGDPVEVDQEQLDDLGVRLTRMIELMELELSVKTGTSHSGARLELSGEDRKLLLQKDGELINSLQFLLNRMSRRAWPDVSRIQLVCKGHRDQRDDDLIEEVREVASQVSRTGMAKKLHPMNPYERRLVHLTIRDFPDLMTRSEGDGFMKTVTVSRAESE